MKKQDLIALIDKYLDGTATEEEIAFLHRYYNSFGEMLHWNHNELGDAAETEARILQKLLIAVKQKQGAVVPFYKKSWVRIAAAFVILLSSVWWFSKTEKKDLGFALEESKTVPIVGEKQTTLTMANGTVMVLDSTPDGILIDEAGAQIHKKEGSISVGVSNKTGQIASAGFHTLKTPKGKQYKAVLADGSKVWLNTASSLRFPAVFAANERRVEVTGEAFFEVSKDAARPFKVLAMAEEGSKRSGTLVEVLGTQFNINAYTDEGTTKTTLLEGSVKIAIAQSAQPLQRNASVLQPGEQAEVTSKEASNEAVLVKKVNVEEVLSWKHNIFHFDNAGLQSIMRQLARWYDVEVVYANKIPARQFSGKISRVAPLSTVLEILEQSNVHFTIKGRQIIVKS